MKVKLSFILTSVLFLIGSLSFKTSDSFGVTYDIKEMTPEVKAALDNRRNRFEQLRNFKEKGIIGENNRGYVEALLDDAEAKALVEAENQDRKFIYKTIVQQNNLPTDALATIEGVFAQVQRDKASPGDKIQDTNGQWITK